MAMTKWGLHAVDVNNTIPSKDVLIDQIVEQSVDTGLLPVFLGGNDSVYARAMAVGSQRPRIRFATTALATALGVSGAAGLSLDAGAAAAVDLWFQKRAEGGTFTAGSVHTKISVHEGLMVPRSLDAVAGQPAVIGYEIIPVYDGTIEPLIIAASQALVGTPGGDEGFDVGPVVINGVQLDGIQEIHVDFGITVVDELANGKAWPIYASIMGITPSIRLVTTEADALSTFGLDGTIQGATDSVVFLTKMAVGATRNADNSGDHISVTVDDGQILVSSVGGSDARAEVLILPTWDGTNAPIVVSTTATISAP